MIERCKCGLVAAGQPCQFCDGVKRRADEHEAWYGKVLALLRTEEKEMYCVEIAEALGLPRGRGSSRCKNACRRLEQRGDVTSRTVEASEHKGPTGQSRCYFKAVAPA